MKRLIVAFLLTATSLAACGGSTSDSSTTDPSAPNGAAAETLAGSMPTDLRPGEVDVRSIELADGTEITYALILPDGFDPTQEYPVLLAMPPGAQGTDVTVSLAESTYAPEALDRGWVVITPASPDGTLYFEGSERHIPEFLALHSWIQAEGDRYHLAGVSNGGRSAFRVASENPESFASMLVFPGFPDADDQDALPELAQIPIAMFVGGDDPSWLEPMADARDTLESLGADVRFEVREGEGHIMSSLSDGVDIFDFFDSVRD